MSYNRNKGGDGMGINERFGAENVEVGPAPPPAWLTAAVLAALPCDGTILDHQAIVRALCTPRPGDLRHAFSGDDVTTALDFLVASGEIETDNIHGVRWRRWGVPEGWGWLATEGGEAKERIVLTRGPGLGMSADIERDGAGYWWKVREWISETTDIKGDAPTLAAARTAALRACYERDVFGPRLRPVSAYLDATQPDPGEPVPSRPRGPGADGLVMGAGITVATVPGNGAAIRADAIDRPALIRAALLAVLTRGPVATRGMLLPIVEGEMGAPAGSVEPAEMRQAAREIGAEVDGPRWSLPAMPPGWGWRESTSTVGLHFLAPLDTPTTAHAVAWVECYQSSGGWQLTGGKEAPCSSLADGQAAALVAARRAGLFARSPAVEVTGDGGPPVLPAVTSQGGEAVVKVASSPLDALALAILGAGLRTPKGVADVLAAFRADILDAALVRTIDHYAAERARMLGGRPEDWRDMSEAGDGPVVELPVGHACSRCATAEREAAEARTSIGVAIRQRDAAERALAQLERNAAGDRQERDEARAELARVRQGILDVMAKGVAK